MRIRWTQAAVRDLTSICDYIRDRDRPAAARSVAVCVHRAVGTLAQFPHTGRSGRKSGTRELVISGMPFLIVYRVSESAVEIVRILHGAQQWP